jgi:hypothetical protein
MDARWRARTHEQFADRVVELLIGRSESRDASSRPTSMHHAFWVASPKPGWVGQKVGTKRVSAVYTIAGELWVVGEQASITHLTGGKWVDVTGPLFPQVPPVIQFTAAHGSSRNDVWVVGTQGYLMHFDGQKTEARAGASNYNLRGVFSISTTDAWAVGDHGTVEHFDGNGWSPVQNTGIPEIRNAYSVWASSPSDVYIAAEDMIAHYDGKTWKKEPTPTVRLRTIWGSSAHDVWAGGLSLGGMAPLIHHIP